MQLPPLPAHKIEDFTTYDLNDEDTDFSCRLIKSLVVPRPIAFITSYSPNNVINAAPFSYFNIVSSNPPIVSISILHREKERKDTAKNILRTKEFVINICSQNLANAINLASSDFSHKLSEVEIAKLSILSSEKVSVPRIANTLVQMECILHQKLKVKKIQTDLILGEVIKVHLHKSLLNQDGLIDTEVLDPLARMSGSSYAKVSQLFCVPKVS